MGKFLDALKNIGLKVNGTKPSSTTTVAVLNEIADDFASGTTATKEYVNSLMSGALKRAIVEELPTTDIDTNTIYMVLDTTAEQGNVYNEYLYINNAWELIGTTEVQTNYLYLHQICLESTTGHINISIYLNDNTQFTATTLFNYLRGIAGTATATSTNFYTVNGYYDTGKIIIGMRGRSATQGDFYDLSIEEYNTTNNALEHTISNSVYTTWSITTYNVKQIF